MSLNPDLLNAVVRKVASGVGRKRKNQPLSFTSGKYASSDSDEDEDYCASDDSEQPSSSKRKSRAKTQPGKTKKAKTKPSRTIQSSEEENHEPPKIKKSKRTNKDKNQNISSKDPKQSRFHDDADSKALPPDVWLKIFSYFGDDDHLARLSDVIKAAGTCRGAYHAHLIANCYSFGIDIHSGIKSKAQKEVFDWITNLVKKPQALGVSLVQCFDDKARSANSFEDYRQAMKDFAPTMRRFELSGAAKEGKSSKIGRHMIDPIFGFDLLTKLVFRSVIFTDLATSQLRSGLESQLNNLQELSILNCTGKLDDRTFEYIDKWKCLPNLKQLEISRSEQVAAGGFSVAIKKDWLTQAPSFESLILRNVSLAIFYHKPGAESTYKLKTLVVQADHIGADDNPTISNLVCGCPSLETLHLEANNMSFSTINLYPALRDLKKLRWLAIVNFVNILANDDNDQNHEPFVLFNLPNVEHLSLVKIPRRDEVTEFFTFHALNRLEGDQPCISFGDKLESLDLHSSLAFNEPEQLCAFIKRYPNLRDVNLEYNHWAPRGFKRHMKTRKELLDFVKKSKHL